MFRGTKNYLVLSKTCWEQINFKGGDSCNGQRVYYKRILDKQIQAIKITCLCDY